MPSTPDRALWLCKKLEAEGSLLTDWERKFIDSIQRQAERPDWSPTGRQMDVLDRIDDQLQDRRPRRR